MNLKGSFVVSEAAEYIGITETLLRQAIKDEKVRVFRFHDRGDLRISRQAADDYIAALENEYALEAKPPKRNPSATVATKLSPVATAPKTVSTTARSGRGLRASTIKKRGEIYSE